MNYTIEIEEDERTLEFTLEVNIWEEPILECGRIEFDIDSVEIIDEDTYLKNLTDGKQFDELHDKYLGKIENMLEEDDKLFEAWQKHTEEV